MTMVARFSSSARDLAERAFWRRLDETQMLIDPHPSAAFSGELQLHAYGAVHVVQTTLAHGQSWKIAACDPEHAFVYLQEEGECALAQAGKQVSLHAGALALVGGERPYTIALADTARLIRLKVPFLRLATHLGDPDRLVAMPAQRSETALLGSFLHALVTQEAQEETAREPGWDDAVGEVIIDLVVLAYRTAPELASRAAVQGRWRRTVRDFVDRHLGDPELGSSMIARHLGVTPRYVQMVFAGMATTASAYILRRRVDLAAWLLAERRVQVTDVALQVGFADLSYFYRSFRERFGISPKRYARTR